MLRGAAPPRNGSFCALPAALTHILLSPHRGESVSASSAERAWGEGQRNDECTSALLTRRWRIKNSEDSAAGDELSAVAAQVPRLVAGRIDDNLKNVATAESNCEVESPLADLD